MTTADERLRAPLAKIGRAKEAVHELVREISRFYETRPFVAQIEERSTNDYILRAVKVEKVPDRVLAIAGEALFNARSALDHLASQLLLAGPHASSLTKKDRKNAYFPIGNDESNFRGRIEQTLSKASTQAKAHLAAINAYRGGDGEWLWLLKTLNDLDKHRLLLTTNAAVQDIQIETANTFETMKAQGIPSYWAMQVGRAASARRRSPG